MLLSVLAALASIQAWRRVRSLVFFAVVIPGRVSAATLLMMVWEVCNRFGRLPLSFFPTKKSSRTMRLVREYFCLAAF